MAKTDAAGQAAGQKPLTFTEVHVLGRHEVTLKVNDGVTIHLSLSRRNMPLDPNHGCLHVHLSGIGGENIGTRQGANSLEVLFNAGD